MDIKEFIELCSGKWFSQRTSYQLEQQKVDNGKAEIIIEFLDSQHPEIIKLCQEHHIAPEATLGGSKASWDNSVDWGKSKQIGHTLLVWIQESSDLTTGQLLRYLGPSQASAKGQYTLGKDEALTLTVKDTNRYTEERIWFASPNLRLRTSLIKLPDGSSQTAFYSEIRKLT